MENTTGYKKRPVFQWVIIYLILGGLIYTAVYYAFMKPETNYIAPTATPEDTIETTSAVTPKVDNLTISAKPSGFEPKTLTIKAGETVTFINQDSKNVDISSSPHPTHTDYPPLNLGIAKPGESKSLSFPTAGTYKFHDHLDASHFGSITVE